MENCGIVSTSPYVAELVHPFNRCSGLDGVTAEDQGMAVLEYKNGVSFAVTNANQKGGYVRRELVVTGSKKTVSLCPLEMPCEGGSTPHGQSIPIRHGPTGEPAGTVILRIAMTA